eukprot:1514244-Rhodomonas_salina.1
MPSPQTLSTLPLISTATATTTTTTTTTAPKRNKKGRRARTEEADAEMLLVAVQHLELPQELDQRAFAKGVRDRRVERERGILRRQNLDPTRLHTPRQYPTARSIMRHVSTGHCGALCATSVPDIA